VFHYWSPQDPLQDEMDDRLRVIEDMLHDYSKGASVASNIVKLLTQYAVTGTGMLRQQIARNHSETLNRMKMNALVSLLSRSIDVSAAFVSSGAELEPGAREGAEKLAQRISEVRKAVRSGDSSSHEGEASPTEDLPTLLSELSASVGSMEWVLATNCAVDLGPVSLDEAGAEKRIFLEDAFTNAEYLKYALAGTAASMFCYVIYVGLNWPGISTAVTTCVLTALSNIGSSRQKQILRIAGASIGGFVLGLGSQMFVLPYIDSIVGLTMLFAFATGVSAYVATSSPRLSYAGLQMAFAFYLINVTDFSISLDLTIGRDRAVGVLLGIGAMWLVFERLYTRSAGMEMVADFARATRLVASLTQSTERENNQIEIKRIRAVRNDVAALFTSVNAESDAVPFESGPQRRLHLAARERVRRWLSTLRTVYVLELPLLHLRLNRDKSPIPPGFHEVDGWLCEGISASLNRIADCLERQLDRTNHDSSGQEKVLDILAQSGAHEFPVASMSVDGAATSVRLLAKLVDDLESDVFKQPVFAS
jgi:multidrug resistance protein MdtO